MDCLAFQAHLLANGVVADPAAVSHGQACAPCAELALAGRELVGALDAARTEHVGDLDPLRARLDAALRAEVGVRASLRGLSTPARASLGVGAVAVVAALTAAALLRPDFALYPGDRMALALLAFACTAAGGVVLSLLPDHLPPLPVGLQRFGLGTLLVLPVVCAVLPVAHAAHPRSHLLDGDFLSPTLACFGFGSAVAVVLLAVLRGLDRRSWWTRGFAVVGLAAGGAAGNLALQLHCPVTDIDHLLVGHAIVGVVWATVAALGMRS